MTKFDELYRKISTNKNYVTPKYPRMDNWAVDLYQTPDGWFAGMGDGGYSRWVGRMDAEGRVLWRVSDYYPKPLVYDSITAEEFEALS